MKAHQIILRDKSGGLMDEQRYFNNILYRQNRSYDIEICFDDFIDRCKTSKKWAKDNKLNITFGLIDKDALWYNA